SSPSTRRRDLIRKRAYYEQFGVPEYWYADLDGNRILVFELQNGRYGDPKVFGRSDILESNHLKGFSAPVAWLLDITGPAGA
ncbi:MAG: Uma2 family endonuclease, partial [Egibacteraceae bacterium]